MVAAADSEWWQVRVPKQEKDDTEPLFVELLERFPVLTRAGIVRAFLRAGIEEIRTHPERALDLAAPRALARAKRRKPA